MAYDSDFAFIETTCKTVAISYIGTTMEENIKRYREILSTTPVDDLEVRDEPRIFFISDNTTWIKVIVRFWLTLKTFHKQKNILLETIKTLRLSLEKVRFSIGDAR